MGSRSVGAGAGLTIATSGGAAPGGPVGAGTGRPPVGPPVAIAEAAGRPVGDDAPGGLIRPDAIPTVPTTAITRRPAPTNWPMVAKTPELAATATPAAPVPGCGHTRCRGSSRGRTGRSPCTCRRAGPCAGRRRAPRGARGDRGRHLRAQRRRNNEDRGDGERPGHPAQVVRALLAVRAAGHVLAQLIRGRLPLDEVHDLVPAGATGLRQAVPGEDARGIGRPQGGPGPVEHDRGRVHGLPQGPGDRVDGQVLGIAQHDGGTGLGPEPVHQLPRAPHGVRRCRGTLRVGGRRGIGEEGSGHEGARARVVGGLLGKADSAGAPADRVEARVACHGAEPGPDVVEDRRVIDRVGLDEGLLDDVLRGGPISR